MKNQYKFTIGFILIGIVCTFIWVQFDIIYAAFFVALAMIVGGIVVAILEKRLDKLVHSRLNEPDRVRVVRQANKFVTSPDTYIDEYCKELAETLDVPACFCSFVFPDKQVIKGSKGLPEELIQEAGTGLEESVCRLVVARQLPLELSDTSKIRYIRNCTAVAKGDLKSCYLHPLKVEGQILGSLGIGDGKIRKWTQAEKTLVSISAHELGQQIEKRMHNYVG